VTVRMEFPFARHASERENEGAQKHPNIKVRLQTRTSCVDISIKLNCPSRIDPHQYSLNKLIAIFKYNI
jgi:hypothetical protein